MDLMMSDRRQIPMDRVEEGQEYNKNVQILQAMLNGHDEFAEHNKRKLKALEEGKPIDQR